MFGSLEELYHGVLGWCRQDFQPEVIAIRCDESDLCDNEDYEGFVLAGELGEIVSRTAYPSWSEFAAFVREWIRESK